MISIDTANASDKIKYPFLVKILSKLGLRNFLNPWLISYVIVEDRMFYS